jgi:hypothetical protein
MTTLVGLWLLAGCFGALLDTLAANDEELDKLSELPTETFLLILCSSVLLGPILIVTSALRWRKT